MKRIKGYVDRIKDELHDAKDYAECYLDNKTSNATWAKYYKTMAEQELMHAQYMHEIAVAEIEELKKAYTPPEAMLEKWEKAHRRYIEKAAFVKQLLAM